VIELHTGAWCDSLTHHQSERAARELVRIKAAAVLASGQGLECHAVTARFCHGQDRRGPAGNRRTHIGHFLIGEAVFIGLKAAIAKMRAAMDEGRAKAK